MNACNDYNIPRKIRELQCSGTDYSFGKIITYQEKLGNYNLVTTIASNPLIITYQEKLGNYNSNIGKPYIGKIITYQEKLGNYNDDGLWIFALLL